MMPSGEPLAGFFGMIAATTLEHNLIVVTRNLKDFANPGVALANPWDLP